MTNTRHTRRPGDRRPHAARSVTTGEGIYYVCATDDGCAYRFGPLSAADFYTPGSPS